MKTMSPVGVLLALALLFFFSWVMFGFLYPSLCNGPLCGANGYSMKVVHSYAGGLHILRGEVAVETECPAITTSVVAESAQSITINIGTAPMREMCQTGPVWLSFFVSVPGERGARIALLRDGEDTPVTFIEDDADVGSGR